MMEQVVAVVDQTVNEALRLGMKFTDVMPLVPILQKYCLEAVDVSLYYFEKEDIDLRDVCFSDLFRCNIYSSSEEITKAKEMGFSKIVIKWIHEPMNNNLDKLKFALTEVNSFAEETYLCIENLHDFSVEEFEVYHELIEEFNIKRFILVDEDGTLSPFNTLDVLKAVQQHSICPIEFHGNNRYGLATANTLAALKFGVKYVGTSIGGVGLPSSAALEEVLMSVKHLWNKSEIISGETISIDCKRVLNYMGIKVPVDKAVIGSDVFAHESGIHVDGIAKNPLLYELIHPEDVGGARKLIIGKHSGTASLRMKFSEWNMSLTQIELAMILDKVRDLAESQKGPLSDEQLKQLYNSQIIDSIEEKIASY